jgi:DNA-binding transcriptional LysR family regulator
LVPHGGRAILQGGLDWNDLRYFLAIARLGTLAAAARELGVDHTTVGRRLTALETALGARLFVRGPEGFTLTEAGAGILPNAETVAVQMDAIARRATAGDARLEGKVRLTVADSVTSYFVPMLSRLRERHPELVVEILSANRVLDIRRGEADLGVRFGDPGDPDLIARKLGQVGWSVYAAPSYLARKGRPQAPDDLSGHDVVAIDDLLPRAPAALWLARHAASVRVVMRGNTIDAVTEAAVAGIGLAPLPCFVGSREPGLVRLFPDLIGARDILLVAHPDLVGAARVRVTMDCIAELFTRDRAQWAGDAGDAGDG